MDPINLSILNLTTMQLNSNQAILCGRLFSQCSKLEKVYLQDIPLGDKGLEAFCPALLNSAHSIKVLHLQRTDLTDDTAELLAQTIQKMVNLSNFCINGNKLTALSAKILGTALLNCPNMAELCIGEQCLGDEGAKALALALQKMTSLAILHIRDSKMTAAGAKDLGNALLSCPKITHLYLGGQPIGDEGMKELAPAIQQMDQLQSLHLSNIDLTDAGVPYLAAALKGKKLTDLAFLPNQITVIGLCILFAEPASEKKNASTKSEESLK